MDGEFGDMFCAKCIEKETKARLYHFAAKYTLDATEGTTQKEKKEENSSSFTNSNVQGTESTIEFCRDLARRKKCTL